MIVTRSWLSEFVNLDGVSNEVICDTFNSIGLEVGEVKTIAVPNKIVIGQVISCQKHPDANKLNVCQIDIGTQKRQIVCGASNVESMQYVAVAMIGAVLPNDIIIKHANLRGVDSEGMLCSSSELGLPDINDGIMVLDGSIGELELGKELLEYSIFNDVLFDIELTPNRGDCLSVYGIARDLSAALERELYVFGLKPSKEKIKLGISRSSTLETYGTINANLSYALISINSVSSPFLVDLRLAQVQKYTKDNISNMIAYATYTTGVILRSYDSRVFETVSGKYTIAIKEDSSGLARVEGSQKLCSIVGVSQEDCIAATDEDLTSIFIESSYVVPQFLVESLADTDHKKDSLYYNTSRGSNPDIRFGLEYALELFIENGECDCHEGFLEYNNLQTRDIFKASIKEINKIIGNEIEKSKIVSVLNKLGFEISYVDDDILAVSIPLFRTDIKNIQDITEEIVRMVGIDSISSKPLRFKEQFHNDIEISNYRAKRAIKQKAAGNGFFEAISYVFTEKKLLKEYGFQTVEDSLDLLNPIVGELNTLRTTLCINLLLAAKRNASYGKKSIPLFEIGGVFNEKREQKEHIGFLWSGQESPEGLENQGKPQAISLPVFLKKLQGIIGDFDIAPCSYENKLTHPYSSADIVINGKPCGYIAKLHPVAQEDFDLNETYIAEVDVVALLPRHMEANPVSNFQGVYKDLSVVIDSEIKYFEIKKVIDTLDISILKTIYPVDIYTDSNLGSNHSLTLRCFIQAMDRTLQDEDTESVVATILEALKCNFGAYLR